MIRSTASRQRQSCRTQPINLLYDFSSQRVLSEQVILADVLAQLQQSIFLAHAELEQHKQHDMREKQEHERMKLEMWRLRTRREVDGHVKQMENGEGYIEYIPFQGLYSTS